MFKIQFLVNDKKLSSTLQSLGTGVYNLEVQPVVNATTKKGKVKAKTEGSASELLRAFMIEHQIGVINNKEIKAALKQLGKSPNSYLYVIKQSIKDGWLVKTKGKGVYGVAPK